MYRVALRIIGSADAAQEVAQDACVKALRGADKFDGRSALATWLHRITVNCAHDHLRKCRQTERGRADWDHDAAGLLTTMDAGPAELAEQNETYRLAMSLVAKLPYACRSAFMLTQLDGYTYDEAAVIENLSRGTVALARLSCQADPNGTDEASSRRRNAMSLSEEKQILLSQLVDGELPPEQANQVLAEVFDELADVLCTSQAARQLHAMLELRQAFDPWRRQGPAKAVASLPAESLPSPLGRWAQGDGSTEQRERTRHHPWISLASAALVGGVLVAGGFVLRGQVGLERPAVPTGGQPMVLITPEQRHDIARAFALHESVAGPLSWYAADDASIHVAPAEKGESLRQPIAIVLRLTRDLSFPSGEAPMPKTYVIVCRSNGAAAIELPSSEMAPNLRLRLLSTESKGQVRLQYVLAADGTGGRGQEDAALAGHRHVGLGQTSLGQLALNDRLVNVDASAWVMANGTR